jgi:hypothetical protein
VLGIDLDYLSAWQRAKLKKSQLFQRHIKRCDSISLPGPYEGIGLDIDNIPARLSSISVEGGLCAHAQPDEFHQVRPGWYGPDAPEAGT